MIYFRLITCIISFSLFFFNISIASQNKILFKINNEIITSYDLIIETKYLKLINKNLENLEKNQINDLALNSLINHLTKKNEILKYNQLLEIDENYFKNLIKNLYSDLGLDSEKEFKNFLNNNNLEYDILTEKIKIEALWNDLIYSKYIREIKIDKSKIAEEIKIKNKNIKSYLLSEIFFQIKNDESINAKFLEIEKIIKEDGFNIAASIFSVSNSSVNGGQIGWVYETGIRKDFLKLLINLNIGEYTQPITLPGGFLVLKIEDIKTENIELDINEEINKIIKSRTNEQLNQFSNIYLKKIKKNIVINDF